MPRLSPEHRRAQIVQAARSLSVNGGLYEWTLNDVADFIGITQAGVKHYFKSTIALRSVLITAAIADADPDILIQALATSDPLVDDLDADLVMLARDER